ncbi:ER membrane protein complex subunit 2-B [Planoprotostelium fungivorum]|uniref:ER membrane protein complex subunit 2 n=1 Tax=Planoprotostelium fungivorum TaxID=1890364 RepID=A0A2P6N9E9_9EUKA|nr:ER membrane protein complex subunit 2-B [Planoprotostelium fungivorum]
MTKLWGSDDFNSVRESLKQLRQGRGRDAQNTVTYGSQLLAKHSSRIEPTERVSHLIDSTEQMPVWEIYEQVFVAALDTHDEKTIEELLLQIITKHGQQSKRVRTLMGMRKEQQEKYAEAEEIYQKILQEDPVNGIAIRRAIGDTQNYIRLLNEYLRIYMGANEAWLELSEAYAEQQMWKSAITCYEENILANPQNHHVYSRYAELCYALGSYDYYKLARKNFAYSYELFPSTRALYGIIQSSTALASTKQGKGDKENESIFEWAVSQLTEVYQKTQPNMAKIVQSFALKE